MGLYEDWLAGSTSRSPFAKALANTEFVFKAMEWAFPNASVNYANSAGSATTADNAGIANLATLVSSSAFSLHSVESNSSINILPFTGKNKLHFYVLRHKLVLNVTATSIYSPSTANVIYVGICTSISLRNQNEWANRSFSISPAQLIRMIPLIDDQDVILCICVYYGI